MDEKQLQEQNFAFKIGYVAAFFSMVICMYLTEIQRIPMTAFSALMICFFIAFAAVSITMSLKGTYFGAKQSYMAFHIVWGILGLADLGLIINKLVNVNKYGMEFLTGGVVNDIVPWVVCAVCLFSMCAVYFIKRAVYNKKFRKEDD